MAHAVEWSQTLALQDVFAGEESGRVQVIDTLRTIADDLESERADVAGYLVLIWRDGGVEIRGSGTASGHVYELLCDAMRYYREATGAPGSVQ